MFYFWGQGRVQKLFFFHFTYVVEQLLFPMFSSILTFDFDLFWGSFFTLWVPNCLFLGLEYGSTTILGSTHVVKQPSFSMIPSILTSNFG